MRSLTCELAVKMSFQPSLSMSARTEHQPDDFTVSGARPLACVVSTNAPRPSLRKSGNVSPESAVKWMSSHPSLS